MRNAELMSRRQCGMIHDPVPDHIDTIGHKRIVLCKPFYPTKIPNSEFRIPNYKKIHLKGVIAIG